ncbi:MAG: vitamin B12 dependent methionine synthase, activation domain protein [Oscillospiraceae bacterium]|nr:vitamin B12 dependent methionine synthase, activation domain protein [Oscillospiraceae bacterium]
MQARLGELDRDEILTYLGFHGRECPAELVGPLSVGMRRVTEAARPRLVYRRLPLEGGKIRGLPLGGGDIRALLAPCREAVLLAVTLGGGVERLLMRSGVSDMGDAVIMDACASAAVESVCENFDADLRLALHGEGLYLTDRFSPGYGDLPLDCQSALCEALNAQRRIGLTVTETQILIPRKSVTAIMGIADTPQPLQRHGCGKCSLSATCPYRKEGAKCHE